MKDNVITALVAADVCIFRIVDGELCVYVTTVKFSTPYIGMNCLPGSLIGLTESAEDTIERVISERTSLNSKDVYIEQLYSFSKVDRDKRRRSVSVAYIGLMNIDDDYINDDQGEGKFVPIHKVKNLAFDHKEILALGVERLISRASYSTIIKKLIRKDFTFSELQKAYEIVMGREIDKRNFRKKIISLDVITETGETKREGRMRPAAIYRWKTNSIDIYDILSF